MMTHLIEAVILGTAQDGGIPQLGCTCRHCQSAWNGSSKRQWAASLGIVDHESQQLWLVDATPDIREQMYLLKTETPSYRLAGVLLTHAHIGHYLGLAFLGREAWNQQQLPVFGTQRMIDFLCVNQPWKQLIDLGNISPIVIQPGSPFRLSTDARATAIAVPHRDEVSDTVAFSIAGPNRTLVYCPDIDRWEGSILDEIMTADIAVLDGTFYSSDELPSRDVAEIPHPCIADSIERFDSRDTEIRFIHLNHSNPLISNERLVRRLNSLGFGITSQGQRYPL